MIKIASIIFASLLAFPPISAAMVSSRDIHYLSLEFGEVPMNTSFSQVIGINAPLDKAMDITGLTVQGDMFSAATNCPPQLQMTQYCLVEITYTPTVQGEHTGSLVVESSEGNLTLRLFGSGI